MARTTVQKVKDIITLSDDVTTANISACILVATTLIDDKLSASGHSDTMLAEIERWLAAHFIAINDSRVVSETIGDATTRYAIGSMGKALEATTYGQQVLTLEHTGTFANLGKRKATIQAIA